MHLQAHMAAKAKELTGKDSAPEPHRLETRGGAEESVHRPKWMGIPPSGPSNGAGVCSLPAEAEAAGQKPTYHGWGQECTTLLGAAALPAQGLLCRCNPCSKQMPQPSILQLASWQTP